MGILVTHFLLTCLSDLVFFKRAPGEVRDFYLELEAPTELPAVTPRTRYSLHIL
jgi:hypothetical protein